MLDVAIIGGGVAGCYCAYRLSTSRDRGVNPSRIALFEASNRIGGRLWSVPTKGGPVAEIGGMFFRANQQNVRGLIEHLALSSAPVEFQRSGQFVRGCFFEDGEFASLDLPFKLSAGERVNGPTGLLLHALEKIVPGARGLWPINRQKPAQATFDRLRGARHDGRPLEQCGLWNVLSDVVSNEAYALLTSTLGTVSLFRNINAFDGVWNLLHEIGDGSAFTVTGGYQSLPLELQARAQDNGAAVWMNHSLSAVSRDDGHLRLRFSGPNGEATEKRTRKLILALPQRALQRLTLSDDLFEDASEFRRVRDRAVLPMRSCKVFLTYDHSWGDAAANTIAAKYTDLPMQQYYCWGAATPGAPALLMAAYADDMSASFWSAFAQGGDAFDSAAENTEDARTLAAPADLVAAVQRQLATMQQDDMPSPRGALFFDWGSEPFGAAWHGWAPHFKSWNIRPWMRRPNPHLDLFICGEAYAQRNGWVEGAINSAELALEQLGLTRPSWVSDPDFQFEVGDRGVGNDDCNTQNVQRAVTRHGAAA